MTAIFQKKGVSVHPKRDLCCARCGYGAFAADPPPACPMCQGSDWEPARWRPFTGRPEADWDDSLQGSRKLETV